MNNDPSVNNFALCRKELDYLQPATFEINEREYEEIPEVSFLKIEGLTNFWDSEEAYNITSIVGDILNSLVAHEHPFVYAIIGDSKGISIYVGTHQSKISSLKSSYISSYPGIEIREVNYNPLKESSQHGGLFTGIPTNKIGKEKKVYQIENLCRGMLGKNFTYVIFAKGISNIAVSLGHERLLDEMKETYSLINRSISGGALGNISATEQDFNCKDYFDNLESTEAYIKEGVSRGMWRINGYFSSDNDLDAKKLGNLIKSSFSGEDSKPDPFRVIEYGFISNVIRNSYMIKEQMNNPEFHPIGVWTRNNGHSIHLSPYKYQTILNSDQLATLCQIPTKEFPGFYIDQYVEFDVSNRVKGSLKHPVPLGDICIPKRFADISQTDNKYYLEKNDFTRHALIIGITGGGKTNTSKSILNTLWTEEKVPFLVIESAKREYWELRNLKGFEDLLVFTLGSEASSTSVKYRINPFETNSSISLQTHIDYLLSTFKAAFDLYPPMPYILEKAVYEIYNDKGWDIVENTNKYGLKEYPTLTDLYNKIDVIVDDLGYHQEVQSNVKAALQARIYSLMIGGKGAMLNTPKSVPISEILSRPVVLELEDIGDDETKSFVIGILLVQLYEYRKSLMTKGSKELSHILMVEEAHRLLKNVSEVGEGGNTKAKSVEFFCNLLAEIRTYGQGIIIADQIPTKIAPDTIKNTNLKLVHRTVAFEDREAMGRAMNMDEKQIDYLSSLQRGYAAVYAEGDNKPKCIKFPLVKSLYNKNRDEVINEVRNKVQDIAKGYDKRYDNNIGCCYCENRCSYKDNVKQFISKSVNVPASLKELKSSKYSPDKIYRYINNVFEELDLSDLSMRICIIGEILQRDSELNDGQRERIIANYLKYFFKS